MTKEEFGSHIVGELVDVEQRLYLIVDTWVVDTFSELTEFIEGLIGTVLELIVLKHIYLLIVIAEISIDKLVVSRLTQVNHTTEPAVDVFRHLHRALHIEVDT